MADKEVRRVAMTLLACGEITPAELTELAGVSRQLMHHWIRRSGVDWLRIRKARLMRRWRKEMHNGPRLVEKPTA